jgi:signal transduction histidine kinase/ActR/RegA family two-component response regulator
MKLRSQILLLLFLFGFIPVFAALAINLPLVMGRLEWFYHKAYLQNLRADFRDLDQHLASRVEMVRLLAKLPEPGFILSSSQKDNPEELEAARNRYADWINQLTGDQQDISQIVFLDNHNHEQFQLVRSRDVRAFTAISDATNLLEPQQLQATLRLKSGGVLTSSININPNAGKSASDRYMTLRLISPIYPPAPTDQSNDAAGPALGAVIITIDVGGIARVYDQTYWVLDNGSYLESERLKPGKNSQAKPSAFSDFPGLKLIFGENKLALWEGPQGKKIIWVPLFATERSGPLWVGREVDPSPIAYIRRELEIRVLLILLGLFAIILMCARWFAVRAERFGQELITGLSQVLNQSKAVTFSWNGPQELRALGSQLTRLSRDHASNNAALRAHAQELEETNRYKSKFLANVSHELRTPLNSILLLSKLLADGSLPAAQSKQAQVIYEAGIDLMEMIGELLDLARLEARKTTLEITQVNLAGLLAGLKDLFEPQFQLKKLWLKLEIDSNTPHEIRTDEAKLGQILKNFLSNAVKFTERGGVVLKLEKNAANNANSYPIRISVRDTGVGIPANKHRIIFEVFEQADSSTRRRYGGTGLGLAISRELAHLLGGLIELGSQEGQGSTFALLLPASLASSSKALTVDRTEKEPAISSNRHEALPSADFNGKKVLLVDDDLRNLLALTPLLEAWKIEVTAAGDAQETLDTLEDNVDFELILMDIMLPDNDGFQIINRIRQTPHFKQLPIICLTANTAPHIRQRCLDSGANELIEKPVDPLGLLATLKHYLIVPEADVDKN